MHPIRGDTTNVYEAPTTPNTDCTHPRADHWHGTRAAYNYDGCRCGDCRATTATYSSYRRELTRQRRDEALQLDGQPDPEWRQRGSCWDTRDPRFFPEVGATRQTPQAKAICHQCPVQAECLDYALTNRLREGIWGGQTPNQRRRDRRRRRVA